MEYICMYLYGILPGSIVGYKLVDDRCFVYRKEMCWFSCGWYIYNKIICNSHLGWLYLDYIVNVSLITHGIAPQVDYLVGFTDECNLDNAFKS